MKLKREKKVSTKIPDSSMADIAFLLIIFFMVTTVFNKETGIDITLPAATKPNILDQNVVHVTVPNPESADFQPNMAFLEGKPYDLETLTARIMQEKMKKQNLYVVLKADQKVPYSVIKNVMDSIQEGFVNKIALAVKMEK